MPRAHIQRKTDRKSPVVLDDAKKEKIARMVEGTATGKEIAELTGAHPRTVDRIMEKYQIRKDEIDDFKKVHGELLLNTSDQAMQLAKRLMEKLNEKMEGQGKESMTVPQMTNLLAVVNSVHGVFYDKFRLQSGMSTQNHANLISITVADALKMNGMAPKETYAGSADEQENSNTVCTETGAETPDSNV